MFQHIFKVMLSVIFGLCLLFIYVNNHLDPVRVCFIAKLPLTCHLEDELYVKGKKQEMYCPCVYYKNVPGG